MNRLQDYKNATTVLEKKEKIGQLFMPAAFINDTEEEIQALERVIGENHIGGLCFFHSRASAATNYEGKKEVIKNEQSFKTLQNLVKRYQQKSKHRLLIAIDAEWGLAMRVENTPQYPYAITLGALQGNTDLVFQAGKNIAYDCKQAGIHYNLAPVSDINNNPNNPVIGYRSFGEDKFNVTEKSLAYVKGMQSEGVICSIKHFPGHGDTAVDSHLGLPIIEKSKEELLANELYPFMQLIKENVDSVMVGHLAVPSLTNG
ncbi:MAG: glycoside hydrolase family 3 N-terminal domain-containing protein, partial [Maribacter sp.]